MGCDHALQDCANKVNATLCGCRGDYTTCLIRLECEDELVDNFIADCQSSGCTEVEVSIALVLNVRFIAVSAACDRVQCLGNEEDETRVDPPVCDARLLTVCSDAMAQCYSTNPESACDCHVAYIRCVSPASCPGEFVSQLVSTCEDAGCPTADCAM
jgi:hypothetical protein